MAVNKKSMKYKNKYKRKINKNIKNKNNDLLVEQDVNIKLKKEVDLNKNNFVYFCKKIILIVFVISVIILFFPRIILSGDNDLIISYQEDYVEPGYNGYVFNKDISKNIDVVSNVKNGVIGEYEVNYYIKLFGARVKKTRIVNVIDDVNPKINVEKEVIFVCPNKEIPNISYEAIDEYDGDITSRVIKTVNEDNILFEVDDLSGNKGFVSVKVDRTDNEKPVIKLKGSSVVFVNYGNKYVEPGYSASDNCSGDLKDKVVVSGNVARDIGTYEIKYTVSDESGNESSVKRKVIVGTKVSDNGVINNGTIYLTFDDGPNNGTTNKILDILKSEGIKATFFVTSKGSDSLIKRIYDEGHTVALHTATHEYSYIYSSVENYFNDLNKVKDRVKRITGVDSKIIRFPGGSSNTVSRSYNRGIMTELTNIVLNEGYRYFDWNVDGKDASSSRNSSDVYYNVTSNLSTNKANVVLLHDTKSITVGALKNIINFGKERGYKFNKIDMNTYMVRHKVNN